MVDQVKDAIEKYKIITIIRGVKSDKLIPTVEMLYKGGIRLFEITFDQKNDNCIEETAKMISMLNNYFDQDVYIGAGTVMSIAQVEAAAKAGAKFVLSPNTDPEVIKRTVDLNMVSIPGAFTPTEIATAYNAKANFVKLFPAGILGMDYIKAICSPLNHIPIVAVGGVNENNLKDFFAVGVKAVGVGSNIVKVSLINEGRYDELEALALKYVCQL